MGIGASGPREVSRLLCKSIYGWLVEVRGESFGVGQGEGAEGLFPALDDAALDESWWGDALVAGGALLVGSGAGSFVFDVADGQPEQLDDGVVGREVPPILDDLAELEVERWRWWCR